tara:strand:+ start:18409 stop:18948 length:540 start_codon:yes stop_codon:yes gene_type:complete
MSKSNKIIKKLLSECDNLEKVLYDESKPNRHEGKTFEDSNITDDELMDSFQSLGDLHLLKSRISFLYSELQTHLGDFVGNTAEPILIDGASIEIKSGAPRKSWDHESLTKDVAQRIYESSIDMDSGEVTKSAKEMMEEILKYGAVSYWRVGALKKLDIDADEYCEVGPSKKSMIIRRDS